MAEGDSGGGLSEGIAASEGDPRVLLVMNAILSAIFGWTVVGGLSLLDLVAFDLINIATVAIVVFSLTYLVTMR